MFEEVVAFSIFFAYLQGNYIIMAEEISPGDRLMVGFLRILVFLLIVILIAIPVCLVLDLVGVLDALGLS